MTYDPNTRTPATDARHDDPRSLGTLLTDLVQQLSTLFRTETTLLKTELRENFGRVSNGAIEIVAGGVLLLAALLVLLQALVAALAELGDMGVGWASLIVGVIVAIIGAVLVRRGSENVSASSLAPDKTAAQVRQDIEVAKEKV